MLPANPREACFSWGCRRSLLIAFGMVCCCIIVVFRFDDAAGYRYLLKSLWNHGSTNHSRMAVEARHMTSAASLNDSISNSRTMNVLIEPFASIMTDDDRTVMAATLSCLTDVLDAANLTYHMCGGTLIGSYRHHGMIPWDDDVDIYVRWSDRFRIETEFVRHMSNDYELSKASTRWKIYSKHRSSKIPGWKWRYPFVDVCFTVEDSRWVYDYDKEYGNKFRYERSTVYPLRRRPFMNMSLWAPHDVETYLRKTYDIAQCKTNTYIHKNETFAKASHAIDCRKLWPYFPFVFRSKTDGLGNVSTDNIVEELKVGDRVLSSIVLNSA